MLVTVSENLREIPIATFCDAGADTRRGRTKPCAWIGVTIQSQGTCTPDGKGRMAHGLMKFYIPGEQFCGARRRCVGKFTPDGITVNETIDVEFDEGTGWIGTKASLFLVGGKPGDVYDVTVTENVPRNECDPNHVIDVYEDPWKFRLTSYFTGEGFVRLPQVPDYHQFFYVVQGAARLVMLPGPTFLPLTNYGPAAKIPLSSPEIQVGPGIYVTEGAI